jgi:hypothetical protein
MSSPYKPTADKIGIQIPERHQNATNAIKPIQKEVSIPIKIEPAKPRKIDKMEKIANNDPEAMAAASMGPLLWFNAPQPLIIEANKTMIIPAVNM